MGAARLLTWIAVAACAELACAGADRGVCDGPGNCESADRPAALAQLGKRLFYDRRLSGDASLACASCHQPDKAFTDGRALATGYTGTEHFRNTPTLVNVGTRAAWLHDGRIGTSLDDVIREMITESYLMNMDMRLMQERLRQDPVYVGMFGRAGLGEPDSGGARAALAAFVEGMVSRGAPVDAGTLTGAAARGQTLFHGRAGCSGCHAGARYTDDLPHNIGVPENPAIWNEPRRHATFVAYGRFLGIENVMHLRTDPGAYIRTHNPEDRRRFLTPSLRELVWSAPYMHNGVFDSLEDVVDFYAGGGGDDPLKDKALAPLELDADEKADLVAFLRALSGEGFDTDDFVWRTDDYGYAPAPGADGRAVAPATTSPAAALETDAVPSLAAPPNAGLAPLGPPPVPADNPTTPSKIALGRMLFFDPILSGNYATPCAVCHLPQAGWSIPTPVSPGYAGSMHWRNSQTIVNAAYYGKLFWDGSSTSLERQARSAARSAVAGNGAEDMMEARLAFVPEYRQRFRDVFGDVWPNIQHAYMAIAAFERSLVQVDTPYDRHLRGETGALTARQERGLELFAGKAGCTACHHGPLLSDEQYHNIGVPPYQGWRTEPLAQVTFRFELLAKGMSQHGYRHTQADPGLYLQTGDYAQRGAFRTPSLRYTRYTAPYMHNGALGTLAEVVEFYNRGGGENEFAATKSPRIRPLGLNPEEVRDLTEFLESLSGDPIVVETPLPPSMQPLAGLRPDAVRPHGS